MTFIERYRIGHKKVVSSPGGLHWWPSCVAGGKLANAGSRIPKPPPMPKPADLRNGLEKKADTEVRE